MDDMTKEALEVKKTPDKTDSFIAKNQKFIIRCANQTLGRFITISDDEFSIALIAFSEALDSFDEYKGSFPGFASMVIRRRLTDHLRSEYRHSREISVEPYSMDGNIEDDEDADALQMEIRDKTARMSENEVSDKSSVTDEIEALGSLLGRYGFGFFDLTDSSPSSSKTKRECAKAVKTILNDEVLLDTMRKKRTLPIKELALKSGVKVKLLERHRKYIIAATEILNGEYPLLAEYMSYIKKDMET
ncbi:MAG: sigma-70 family RNA polymerase sigma factor [Lachnospiraceae bacterium]|nr:sigma-70 family RNA polymerase sigma factor [Lachnospiraceae bacterium]